MAKNQFLNWEKSLKLPELQFHEKFFLIYLISRVFLPGRLKIFWPAVTIWGLIDNVGQYAPSSCTKKFESMNEGKFKTNEC